ncbi:MAG: HD domain-containing protein [Rhodothermales bacterium]|nr:HD domain-containing protein [Rhodothermales bacterium]MBO6778750.1 HD domain-containing protein [Rhodothermales bacterium]
MGLLETLIPEDLAEVLAEVGAAASETNVPAWVVGGFVRDALIGRPTTDIDFVSVGKGSGIALAEEAASRLGGASVHVYRQFGTAAIRIPRGEETIVLEFVGARRESYDRNSRKPRVEDGTLEDDLKRRDFTVNALAAPIGADGTGELVDRFSGLKDLDAGVLRTPVDPYTTFSDDPLRMVRAARFAAQLGFRLDDETWSAMRAEAARIEIVSMERIAEELQKLMSSPKPSSGFKILEETGILTHFLPELSALRGVEQVDGHRHKDNFYHTLQVVDNLVEATSERPAEETLWLRWAALLHDIGKPSTKRFREGTGWTFHGHEDRGSRMVPKLFRRLKLPLDDRSDYVEKLVRLHHRPVALVDDQVTDSAVRRLLFDAGDDVEDLMTLVRADITSKNPARVRRYLRAFDRVDQKLIDVEEADNLRNFRPPVDGLEIMEALGIGEGLAIGILKERITEAILEGEIPNDHDPAYALMMAHKDDAIRRGELFKRGIDALRGPEKRAVGAIKEAVLDADLPDNDDEAWKYLMQIKDRVLNPA